MHTSVSILKNVQIHQSGGLILEYLPGSNVDGKILPSSQGVAFEFYNRAHHCYHANSDVPAERRELDSQA